MTTSIKMEDNLRKKMEDDLRKNGSRPKKDDPQKNEMEDDLKNMKNGRLPQVQLHKSNLGNP
jgi:hypothetical protein